jgi:hypothetical protein
LTRKFNINISIAFLVSTLAINIISLGFQFLTGEKIWLGIGSAAYYCVYFFVGYIFAKYRTHILNLNSHIQYSWILGGIIWVIFARYWRLNDNPVFLEMLPVHGVIAKIIARCYNYGIAFVGIMFFCGAMYLLNKIFKFRFLEYIGKMTLEIYVMHFFLIGIIHIENIWLEIIIRIVFGIIAPVGIALIIEKNYISRLLFGKRVGD